MLVIPVGLPTSSATKVTIVFIGRNALTTNATMEVAQTHQYVLPDHEDPNLAGTTTFEVVIAGKSMSYPARKGGETITASVEIEPGREELWAEVVQEAQSAANKNAFDVKILVGSAPIDAGKTVRRNDVANAVPGGKEAVVGFDGQPSDWFAWLPIGFE